MGSVGRVQRMYGLLVHVLDREGTSLGQEKGCHLNIG